MDDLSGVTAHCRWMRGGSPLSTAPAAYAWLRPWAPPLSAGRVAALNKERRKAPASPAFALQRRVRILLRQPHALTGASVAAGTNASTQDLVVHGRSRKTDRQADVDSRARKP